MEIIKSQNKSFTKVNFDELEGHFLNDAIATSLNITNFEYTINGMRKTTDPQTAFISFTKERIKTALGAERNWPSGDNFVKVNSTRIALYITETPIMELSDTVVQFIVPDTWEFMHQVGNYLRNRLDIPAIAITGSVGKTTTRMMIEHLFSEDYQVLSNQGNHNTRFAIPLYMAKLVQSPDILNLEVSLNALNYRGKGPQSTFVRPTIAILTSISFAHMSTMKDLNGLAKLKANIFNGLDEQGVAIINHDIPMEQRNIAWAAAKEKTNKILTYSMTDSDADLHLISKKELKDITEVTVSYHGELYTYYLCLSSAGIVENSLAVILVLKTMGIDPDKYLSRFLTFHSLPKVMERKRGYIDGKKIDIIDDTHNAAIPSMINAITSFTNKVNYYSGRKLLALGQVADLGKFSEELHESLIPYINNSGADMLLGYGESMKDVVDSTDIPSQWFGSMDEYLEGLRKEITENSLILLKGSVSASDYHRISVLLDGIRSNNRL